MSIPCPPFGSYPKRDGNSVHPLIDGVPAFRRIGEAIDQAQHSVWLTVAFYAPNFLMPDGRGALFDVLDRTVTRGLDVRVIFWRPNAESIGLGGTFAGSPAERDLLRNRGSQFRARWDRGHGRYAHHQKSWLIDAGQPSEVAFIGGINLTAQAVGFPGHRDGNRHDIYVEVRGPASTDVHHNFVQRWNEASDREAVDGSWGSGPEDQLPFPAALSDPCGSSIVQIQRNVAAGHYSDGTPSPGGAQYPIAGGERTIFDQYLLAIKAARHAIYIENQAIPIPPVTDALADALRRGVELVVVVPAQPERHVRAARRNPERRLVFDHVAQLGTYKRFTLAGIASQDTEGDRRDIYVHAKVMLVDDEWATIGSCNLHSNSLFGHTEMNASIWDGTVVQPLRRALLAEHLDFDTADYDARAALQCFRSVAQENRRRRDANNPLWQGIAYQLNPATYGE